MKIYHLEKKDISSINNILLTVIGLVQIHLGKELFEDYGHLLKAFIIFNVVLE